MKLLLTSTGIANEIIHKSFVQLVGKPLKQIKVVFIPTASRFDDELVYVEVSRRQLVDVGVKNIKTLNLDHQITAAEIADADVIYVCGGNTFYLMQQIHESGFDKALRGFDGLYFGVSAGSIVVGPNVEVSGPWDENDVKLSDTTGMGIIDFAVIPHYQRKEKSIVEKLKSATDYDIIELTDDQAIIVHNNKIQMIGG